MSIKIEVIDTFDFHQAPVYALVADEHHLYSAGGDRHIIRYHPTSNHWEAEPFAQTTESTFVLFRDGSYLFSGGIAGNLNVFDITEKKILHRFACHAQGIYAITANDDFLITGGGDGKIHLWSKVEWRIVRTIWTEESKIRGFIWNHNKTQLASIDNAGYFRVFDTQWWNEIFTFKHTSGWTSGCFHPIKKAWILGSKIGELVVCPSMNPTPLLQIQAHQNAIYGLIWDEEAHGLVSGSLDKTVKWWNGETLDLIGRCDKINDSMFRSVNSLLKWKDLLAIAGDNKKIHLTKICFFE